jgi:hypothetical protein
MNITVKQICNVKPDVTMSNHWALKQSNWSAVMKKDHVREIPHSKRHKRLLIREYALKKSTTNLSCHKKKRTTIPVLWGTTEKVQKTFKLAYFKHQWQRRHGTSPTRISQAQVITNTDARRVRRSATADHGWEHVHLHIHTETRSSNGSLTGSWSWV